MTKVTNHRRSTDFTKKGVTRKSPSQLRVASRLRAGPSPCLQHQRPLRRHPTLRFQGRRSKLLRSIRGLVRFGRDVLFVRFERKRLMIVSGHRDGRKRRASRDCRRPSQLLRVFGLLTKVEQRLLGHMYHVVDRPRSSPATLQERNPPGDGHSSILPLSRLACAVPYSSRCSTTTAPQTCCVCRACRTRRHAAVTAPVQTHNVRSLGIAAGFRT